MKNLVLKVKMMDKYLTKIGGDIAGEWYDLRASNIKSINGSKVLDKDYLSDTGMLYYEKGDVLLIGLGLAIQPPENYEIILAPRSSTFKNYGFLLSNSVGIGDCSYRGEYMAMVYCTRDGKIDYNDRFLQFRVQKQQPTASIEFVDELGQTQRGAGAYGSSGVK